jgi:F420-0:gamma-glutamyl ligase
MQAAKFGHDSVNYLQMEPNGNEFKKSDDGCIFFETNSGSRCKNNGVDESSPVRFVL